ncbi:spoIIIJ-associated protein [Peptoniphilus ivorii]|uniref:RNA-binding cell elongation regulator Jag/EloR n=1 Tax=Aedoeadaptatus ivorii TaxID=54006 RepID=UPI00278799B5|nr:RNA-binding cell elongation regulator Jag/EloR [Peptoniphilus ivorii]MDQ0508419.1 spoIIIJ-associated protein [Peptoniphilus ivorii]
MSFSIQSAKTVEEAVEKALAELRIDRDRAEVEIIEEPSKGFLGLIGGKDAIVKVSEKIDSKDIVEAILGDELTKDAAPDPSDTQKMRPEPTIVDTPSPSIDRANEEGDEEDDEEAEFDAEERREAEFFEDDDEIEAFIREYVDQILTTLELGYTLSVDFRDRNIEVAIDGKQEETGIVIGKHGSTLNGIQTVLSAMINQRSREFRRVIVDCSGYRKKREATLKRIAGKTANKVLKTGKSAKLEPMDAQERRVIHACLANVEGVRTRSEGKDPHRRVVIHKETSQPS